MQSLADHPHHTMSREPSFLHSIHENHDYIGTGPQVSAFGPRRTTSHTVRKPTTAPSLELARSQTGRSEDLGLYRNSIWTSIGSRQSQSRQGTGIDPRTMIVGRPYSKAGRPIAQVSKIPDPVSLFFFISNRNSISISSDLCSALGNTKFNGVKTSPKESSCSIASPRESLILGKR